MRNYAMLRESVKNINIEISPWTMNELRNKNVTSIRQLLYQMYIGLKKHEQQRDAPFNGPVVYSTIESISRPGSKETVDQNYDSFHSFDNQLKKSQSQQHQDIDAMIEQRRRQSEKLASLNNIKPMKLNKPKNKAKRVPSNTDNVIDQLDHFEEMIERRKLRQAESRPLQAQRVADATSGRVYMDSIKRESHEKRQKEIERSARRRKVLVDTVQDMFESEQNERDKVLMERVSRDSALERRLATQLMSIRDEKKTLIENRIRLNREFEADRLKKYNEYLDREAEVGRIQRATEKAIRLETQNDHQILLQKKADAKRAKHVANCKNIVSDLISFSMNLSELNVQTLSNIPVRVIKDMREVFIKEKIDTESVETDDEDLDNCDKEEYMLSVGDWAVNEPELAKVDNKIFDRFYDRLLEIVTPSPPKNDTPLWPLRLGIIGKDEKYVRQLTEAMMSRHPLVALNHTTLIREAVEAAKNEETVVHTLSKDETEGSFEIVESSQLATPSATSRVTSAKGEKKSEEEAKTYETASDRAKLGSEILTFLENGESVPPSLVIAVLKEALNRVPASSGWVIESFPESLDFFESFQNEIVTIQAVLYIESSDDEIIALNSELEEPKADIVETLSKFNDSWTEFSTAYNDYVYTFSRSNSKVLDEIEDAILEIVRKETHVSPKPEKTKTPTPPPPPEPVTEEPPPRPPSSKSRSGSAKKGKKRGDSASSKSSKKSGSRSGSAKKKKEETIPPEDIIKPGDDKWEWVLVSHDESVPRDFYHRLHQSLLDSDSLIQRRLLKSLKNIRAEQYSVISYLGDVLDSFKRFIKRPDPKQEYVSQWQIDFNQLEPDVRHDSEVQNELHKRVNDLQDQLFEIADERKTEAEEERKTVMTSLWLKDKLHLIFDHFINLAKQEIIKTSVKAAVIRKHYAFQAEMMGDSNPFKKEVFTPKPIATAQFELEIETEELADSEEIVSLADFNAKLSVIFDSLLSGIDNLVTYENAITNDIKYTPPKPVEEPPPPAKSPKGAKGKKSPKPKSAGKKGKKSATPVEEKKGPDPIIVAKVERGEKCKEEAREGTRILAENSKTQIRLIKSVLLNTVNETRDRFEQTFTAMFDIIGKQFNTEVNATIDLVSLAQSAIENGRELDEPFYLKGNLNKKLE